jgi:hypothetical protein
MQPLDRRSVNTNSAVTVQVEGRDVAAKVQAVLPLPEGLRVLRELATPFGAATLIVPNSKGDLEPGQRVQSPNLPSNPIATVPKRAVKPEDSRGSENMMVQVIRDEYVTNIPIRVLGENGSERVQISGALRAADSLIASSSVPLLPGTLVRFGENGTGDANGATPASGGADAGVTGPAGGRGRTPATGAPANAGTSKRRPQSGRSAAGGNPF